MKTAKWTISITRDIYRMVEVNDINKESKYKLLPLYTSVNKYPVSNGKHMQEVLQSSQKHCH